MAGHPAQAAFEGGARAVSTTFDDRETAASLALCTALALALRPRPAVVLDVGCGTGQGLALLRRRLPTAALHGVDPVPEALTAARARLGADPLVTLHRTTADALTAADVPPVDLAVCHLNLALWDDPLAGLLAVTARLAPGGVLYVVDLARVEGERRTRLLRRARDEAEREYLAGQVDASLDLAAAQRLTEAVVAGAPELGLVGRCAAGGLAGHGFTTPEAAALWADPDVRAAVAGFGRPADGAADDDVLHWELRRG